MLFKKNITLHKTINEVILEEYDKKDKVLKNKIILQDKNKKGFNGTIYDILLELCCDISYRKFKKYLVVKNVKKWRRILLTRFIFNVRLIEFDSIEYYENLYESKYIITNDVLPTSFIKPKEQIVINIIEEEKVFEIGRSNNENSYKLGKKQRNLIMSDYIICLNEDIVNKVRKEFMIDNLYKGKYFIPHLQKNGQSIKDICKVLLNEQKGKIIDSNTFNNNKPNVLIFTGSLIKNGITASLKGLINNIDLEKRNYFLTFYRKEVKKNKYLLSEFPTKINYILIDGDKILSEQEEKVLAKFYEDNLVDDNIKSVIKKIYTREINRIYPELKFDYVIDFCGYNKEMINLLMYMNSIKIRYTHSNLKREYETRQNIHIPSLKLAYKNYDKVIAVREGMEDEINKHFEDIKPKEIKIIHNLNDIENTKRKAELPIEFQENTYSNIEKEKLEEILNDENSIKFINIARFSKEKGLDRLIRTFDEFCSQNKTDRKAYLIIIGGHGKIFEDICNMIKERKLENVIIIRNIQNPLSILKKCNLFILSSYYEGLPMTIMESLILDIPTASVDIEGPRKFFKKGYVYLVEDSEEGLLKCMNDYIDGKIVGLNRFNAEDFNKIALQEFENIFIERNKNV